jgi:hypothetical protein
MAKREIYYGSDLWKDSKFGVVAARDWLAAVNSDDPALRDMLSRVANGEYLNINKQITKFVVELQRSKHGDNDVVMGMFFSKLVGDLIKRLKLDKITSDGLEKLRINKNLIKLPDIVAEIDRIIRKRNNTLAPK